MKPAEARALYKWKKPRHCAAEIDMSVEFIRNEIRTGRLRARDFGTGKVSRYRVRPEDWDAYLRERQVKAS